MCVCAVIARQTMCLFKASKIVCTGNNTLTIKTQLLYKCNVHNPAAVAIAVGWNNDGTCGCPTVSLFGRNSMSKIKNVNLFLIIGFCVYVKSFERGGFLFGGFVKFINSIKQSRYLNAS